MDEIIENYVADGEVFINKTPLNRDKNIYLLRAFLRENNKKYLKSSAILISNVLFASNFADTALFFEELNLFEQGNEQNVFFEIVKHQKNINLKLKIKDLKIFISKSEARAMYKIYNLSFVGYSLVRLLEDEYQFTPQNLAPLLLK